MEPEQKDQELQLLTELEQRISDLLEERNQLLEENQVLKEQQGKSSLEKAGLQEKHRQVYSKIETMLSRLKTLE